jgi:hypothetical protein
MTRRLTPSTLVLERRIALVLALLRTGLCAYRAATQSVVHDEAYSYNTFLNGSWSLPYVTYNAGNHILFSFLAKGSIALFGLSELSLRLPAVTAGFFLMWGIYRILERTDSRALRWAMFLALGLHPLLLDFSVAARGYGLALALLIWAMEYALRGRRHAAGVLLGLALSANFTMTFPYLALLGSLALTDENVSWRRPFRLWPLVVWPTVVVGAICGKAIQSARRDNFYAGMPTIRDSLQNLLSTSVFKRGDHGLIGTPAWVNFFQFVGVPLVSVFVAVLSAFVWRRGATERRKLVPALTLAISAFGLISAHLLLHVAYPIDRTGLYIVVLAGIGWALVSGEIGNKWFRAANVVLVCVLGLQFATQFDTKILYVWEFDWRVRDAAHLIMMESRGKPPLSVSIGATWIHQPALEFYRQRYHITALQPVERLEHAPLSGHDYYVLSGPDKDDPAAQRLNVVLSDPYWGMVLALEPPGSRWLFDSASQRRPAAVQFSPNLVHPGMSYEMAIPALAGQSVDLLYSLNGGEPTEALRFRRLDALGRVIVALPRDFGPLPMTLDVRGVRRSGDRLWLAASGRIDVTK